jgi:MFS family permease
VGFGIAPHVGWRMVLLGSGLTALWAVVVRKHLPESPLWEKKKQAEISVARHWLRTPQGLSILLRSFVLATFKLGTYWTCYTWLPKFFLTRFHEPLGRSLLWILTAQVGQFIGMMAFGKVADQAGRRQAFTIFSLITGAALGTLAVGWPWLLTHRAYFWITMAGLGFGSGCTAGFGALLAELYPTAVRNFGMGTTYNCARGVQILAPAFVYAALTRWDVTGALLVPTVLAVATAAWVWTLPETRGRNLEKVLSS